MNKLKVAVLEDEPVMLPPVPALDSVESDPFDAAQISTNVNPDFSSDQLETIVNPDFSSAQLETMVNPEFGSDADAIPDFDITPNEEVATKLDLAKAYEEMGDLEGARELLQEVVKEGDAAQQEKAQALLVKMAV